MQKSSFFNAILDQEGSPDRSYLAEDFARYFSSFIGNGVFPNPATNLQVIAIDDDMTVRVKSGKAWINGYFYENTDDYILELEPADGVLNRIDRIVLRLDFIDREIRVYVKQGEFASNAIAKELQRDADAYEIALADIKVNAGVIKITQSDITDTRLNKELCGIVHGTVEQVDTTAIFNQFESWYEQTKSAYDADMATWTTEKKQAFDDWYETNTTAFIEQFESWYNNNTTQWTNNFNTWFETIKDQLDGDLGAKLSSQILELEQTKANKIELDAVNQDLDTHKADDVSQREVHGLRVNNEKLEYYTGTEWKIASGGIPVGNVSGLSVEEGNAEITLMWTDPEDRYLDDIKIAEWKGTKIIRKTGSYPVSDDDGVLVVDNAVRNQYSNNGYKDTGLTNEVTYYYMAFPYTEDAITVDGANRVAGTPTDVDDPSGSPGAKNLISGTMEEGFFGEVPASELITGDALASECGISQGTSQHSTAGWLKFAYKGEILFVAKKPIRHSISWDAINTANCVYGDSGDKTVTIGGLTYKVRLMRALEPTNDPKTTASAASGVVNHYSEWNRLMCQIHEQAIGGSWDYPDNIENDIGILEHSLGNGTNGMYNDADLVVRGGDSRFSWCQEMSTSTSYRLFRGGAGVSYSDYGAPSYTGSHYGWRPVLELVP